MNLNTPDAELVRLIRQVLLEHKTSIEPRPQRRRSRRGIGSPSTATDTAWRFARVITAIPPGTHIWQPSTEGTVNYFDDSWVEIDDPSSVTNRWYVGYAPDTLVKVAANGDVEGPCSPAPSGFWDPEEGP